MTERIHRALLEIEAKIKENEPLVLAQFKSAGVTPNEAVVYSAAMYYETIKQLAKE